MPRSKAFVLLFLCCCWYGQIESYNTTELRVGVLLPTTSTNQDERLIYKQSLERALHRYSTEQQTSTNVTLKYYTRKVTCDDVVVSEETSRLLYDSRVDVLIGVPCKQPEVCQAVLNSVAYNEKLFVSYDCNDFKLNNESEQFVRIKPTVHDDVTQLSHTFKLLANQFKWKQLAVVYTNKNGWNYVADSLIDQLTQWKYDVRVFQVEIYDTNMDLLTEIKRQARVILFLCPTPTITSLLATLAQSIKKDSHHYAIITVDFDMHQAILENQLAVSGILNIRALLAQDQITKTYLEYVNTTMTENNLNKTGKSDHVLLSAAYLHDSVMAYVENVRLSMQEEYQNTVNAYMEEHQIDEFLSHNNLSYVTYMTLNDTSKRNWTYPVYWENRTALQNGNLTTPQWYTSNESLPVLNLTGLEIDYNDVIHNQSRVFRLANFSGITGEMRFYSHNNTTSVYRKPRALIENIIDQRRHIIYYHNESPHVIGSYLITWFGYSKIVPEDIPSCGFLDECLVKDMSVTVVLAIVAGVVILFLGVCCCFRLQKIENEINSQESVLDFKEFTTLCAIPPNTSLSEFIDKKGFVNQATSIRRLNVCYREKRLMLKKLPKKSVCVDRTLRMEWKMLRDLRHPNINRFRGVTITAPNICILYEYCSKGSLYDIFHSVDMAFDWDFKYTFLYDIVSAMHVIHNSPLNYHGHLTSKNCLINSRWMVQIGDFGLTEFRKQNSSVKSSTKNEKGKFKDLLWTAPENLTEPLTCSKEGDVFSFGIILSEIITQKPPYFDRQMQAGEIIHYVKKRCIPPFRPNLPQQTDINQLTNLMVSCWNETPKQRPTFKSIKLTIQKLRGPKVDIIENMMSMMEKYSKELEKIIEDSNDMIARERRRNNNFILKSLPKPLAEMLLLANSQGYLAPFHLKRVSFMHVCIANFSEYDITPEKLVQVINDFQKMVEKLLTIYKSVHCLYSFKEEAMICSNVPGYNPQSNAQTLLQIAIRMFQTRDEQNWRHVNNNKIEMKVVLHSGGGSGVVTGSRVPAYCVLSKDLDYLRSIVASNYIPQDKIVMTEEFKKTSRVRIQDIMKSKTEMVCMKKKKKLTSHLELPKEQENVGEAKPIEQQNNKTESNFDFIALGSNVHM